MARWRDRAVGRGYPATVTTPPADAPLAGLIADARQIPAPLGPAGTRADDGAPPDEAEAEPPAGG